MYDMMIAGNQPRLRNGSGHWTKPILDEKGTFFPSSQAAMTKYDLSKDQVSKSVRLNVEVAGHLFRFAKVPEVEQHLGDKVQLFSAGEADSKKKVSKKKVSKKKVSKKKVSKKKVSKKRARTIHVDGELQPLALVNEFPFEGHMFPGGPAVLVLPGTGFSMSLPSKDAFPQALRDACRWS